MAELPLDQAIPRFKTNEARVDMFANGSNTDTYTASGGSQVPSIRKFLADKDAEINVGSGSILTQATNAKNAAAASATAAATSATNAATSASAFSAVQNQIKYTIDKYGITTSGDQTSNFATLEAAVSNQIVDLKGGSYPVTALPLGNIYINGQFVIKGIGIPMKDAFRFRTVRITKTNKYSKWAQDKAHVSPRGVICVPYIEGDNHHDLANTLWCKYSYDGGATFGPPECIYRPETGGTWNLASGASDSFASMAAGSHPEGRQFFFLTTQETSKRHLMLHRKFPDYRKWDTGATFSMTAGNATITVTKPGHGYVVGDKLSIKKFTADAGATDILAATAGTPYNGITIPNEVTVTAAGNQTFSFVATAVGTISAITNKTSVLWVQNPWGDFVTVDCTSAMRTYYDGQHGTGTFDANNISYHHSFCTDDSGNMYSCISDSTLGLQVIKYSSYRTVAGAVTIYLTGFPGGEGTIKHVPTSAGFGVDNFIGFSRGDDFDSANNKQARFWKTTNGFASVTSEILRTDSTKGGLTQDEPTPLIIANGMVYAVRCQRTDDPTDTASTDRASLKMYLLTASLSALLASGIAAFKWTEMGRAYWSGAKTGQSSPGVGVGSLLATDVPPDAKVFADSNDIPHYARVMYFYGSEQENPTGFAENWNQGQLYATHIADNRAPYYAIDNGYNVDSGQADSTQQFWWHQGSDLGTGWTAAVGTYATADPPDGTGGTVDLRNSPDYKGGGIRLEREANGMVTMFGRINATSSAVNPVMTLPHGWRPAHDKTVVIQGGASKQDRVGGRLLVLTIFGANNIASMRGKVYIEKIASGDPSIQSVPNISLDGIRFPADGDARVF